MPESWIARPCASVSETHRRRAAQRQAQLTKPPGSLGRLETLAVDLAALQSSDKPSVEQVPLIVFAGDHGVTAQGVSAFPAEVTVQMLANFAAGGAASAVLARAQGLPLHIYDVGSSSQKPISGVNIDKIRYGTQDLSVQPAMDEEALHYALAAGARALDAAAAGGADALILGEMGIGNTTSATALSCVLANLSPVDLTGAGTGLDGEGAAHKQQVIETALALHRETIASASQAGFEALRCLGGLEIAALTGAMIASAQRGIPVLVDGFIVTAAALAAVRIQPGVRDWLLFSHCSAERGHQRLLIELEAEPLLHLDLRLGEGSGAALALSLLRQACALHNRMATFAEAAVSNRGEMP